MRRKVEDLRRREIFVGEFEHMSFRFIRVPEISKRQVLDLSRPFLTPDRTERDANIPYNEL